MRLQYVFIICLYARARESERDARSERRREGGE